MSFPGLAAAVTVHQTDRFTLDHIPQPGQWRHQAACNGADPDLFFPRRGNTAPIRAAKQLCSRCPVRPDCLAYAVDAGPYLIGIWGGTTGRERNAIRHQQQPQVCEEDDRG